MAYEDFEGLWKVNTTGADECPKDSIVTFDRTGTHQDPGKVTILCCGTNPRRFPYGEGNASYNSTFNTIEVPFEGATYAISLMPGTPPQITFGPKVSGLGQVAGSWTASDYVPPGSKPEPAGE